jgi:hypothetical protein
VTIHFGKFKGEDIANIPLWYLKWLEENVDWITPDMREAINYEIARREGDVSSLGREVK